MWKTVVVLGKEVLPDLIMLRILCTLPLKGVQEKKERNLVST
jgi:hypothetical protein